MRQRRIDRGALTLASAEVKFQIDTETHDPLDIGMFMYTLYAFQNRVTIYLLCCYTYIHTHTLVNFHLHHGCVAYLQVCTK